jgi:hypothetical protein
VKLTKKDETSVEFVAMVQSGPDSKLNQTKAIALEDIRVVQDFPDVFLEELPGMPPDRDIVFLIELLPGTPPISKRPYRMPVNELVELKKQIVELQTLKVKMKTMMSEASRRPPNIFLVLNDKGGESTHFVLVSILSEKTGLPSFAQQKFLCSFQFLSPVDFRTL